MVITTPQRKFSKGLDLKTRHITYFQVGVVTSWPVLIIFSLAMLPLYWSALMKTQLLQYPPRLASLSGVKAAEKQKGHNAGMLQKDKNSNWLYYQNPSCHHVEHFQTSFTPQKSIQTPAFVQTQMRQKRWNSTFKIYVPIIISILKLTSPSSQTKHVHI